MAISGNLTINVGLPNESQNSDSLYTAFNKINTNFDTLFANAIGWTSPPMSNVSLGTAGQAAYDTGGNLYICVSANNWAKITGTTSW